MSPESSSPSTPTRVITHTGEGELRHKLGHCFTIALGSATEAGFCGDERCTAARDSGVSMLHDRRTGRVWLHFPDKPEAAVIASLDAAGWRFSGYRQAWHHPSRFTLPPVGVAFLDGGECAYSDERAERLEGRASNAASASAAAHGQARAAVAMIPFGQPILKGHHSERRHRKAIARSDAHMRNAVALSDKAEGLERAAEGSRSLHAHQDSALGTALRLKRAQAELRRLERSAAGWAQQPEEYERRIEDLKARIAADKEVLAALPQLPCATADVEPGDKVRIRGNVALVYRVNRKTYGCVILEGGARGWTMNWEREHLQEVLQKRAVTGELLRKIQEHPFNSPHLREVR